MPAMTEERIQRRLAAIAVADVVGYSRLMEADEAGTLRSCESGAQPSSSRRCAAMAGGSSRSWVTEC